MKDKDERIESRVRAALRFEPPTADAENRMLLRASQGSSVGRPLAGWHSRRSALAAAALLVLIGVGLSLWPGRSPEADVAARAMAAMSQPGTVIHFTMESWEWSWESEPEERHPDLPSRLTEAWVDEANGRIRVTERWRAPAEMESNYGSGRELLISDGFARILGECGWTTVNTGESHTHWLYEERDMEELPPPASLVHSYSEMLRDGTAELVEDEDVDADIVRVRFTLVQQIGWPTGSSISRVVTADLRRSDYLPVRLRLEWEGVSEPHGGVFGEIEEAFVDPRVVSLEEVPAGAFQLDVPPDATIEISRTLRKDQISEAVDFDVYWIGETFEEASWQGYFDYNAPSHWCGRWGFEVPYPGQRSFRIANFAEREVAAGYRHAEDRVGDRENQSEGETRRPEPPAVEVISMRAAAVGTGHEGERYAEPLQPLLRGEVDEVVHHQEWLGTYVARMYGDSVVIVLAEDEAAARRASELVRKVDE